MLTTKKIVAFAPFTVFSLHATWLSYVCVAHQHPLSIFSLSSHPSPCSTAYCLSFVLSITYPLSTCYIRTVFTLWDVEVCGNHFACVLWLFTRYCRVLLSLLLLLLRRLQCSVYISLILLFWEIPVTCRCLVSACLWCLCGFLFDLSICSSASSFR